MSVFDTVVKKISNLPQALGRAPAAESLPTVWATEDRAMIETLLGALDQLTVAPGSVDLFGGGLSIRDDGWHRTRLSDLLDPALICRCRGFQIDLSNTHDQALSVSITTANAVLGLNTFSAANQLAEYRDVLPAGHGAHQHLKIVPYPLHRPDGSDQPGLSSTNFRSLPALWGQHLNLWVGLRAAMGPTRGEVFGQLTYW